MDQTIDFCGVGAHHQNGVAERDIYGNGSSHAPPRSPPLARCDRLEPVAIRHGPGYLYLEPLAQSVHWHIAY
jgi:hypothetical protein